MLAYEQQLKENRWWGVREGSRYFAGNNEVHKALRRITSRLEQLGIPYAVAGGMALYFHAYARFTEDVDVLVSREGLERIQQELRGRGYRPLFAGSKNLRDTEHGVRIEFIVSGEYPGDGKPKPVVFPDPGQASIERGGIHFLPLRELIELKLASGMTNRGRLKDLADVQEMIRTLQLPLEFADGLNLYVRNEFRALWQSVHEPPTTEPTAPA